jgi:hypothetical protein
MSGREEAHLYGRIGEVVQSGVGGWRNGGLRENFPPMPRTQQRCKTYDLLNTKTRLRVCEGFLATFPRETLQVPSGR